MVMLFTSTLCLPGAKEVRVHEVQKFRNILLRKKLSKEKLSNIIFYLAKQPQNFLQSIKTCILTHKWIY